VNAAASVLTRAKVVSVWWPLALSWLLMGVELPLLSAHVARLPEPKVQLAAYGSLVFPICLLIEAPIIMLLAASTALCTDRDRFRRVRGWMNRAGLVLTLVHLGLALTPLYDIVANDLLDVPGPVAAAGRIGLVIMTPWTWSIAYRRFHQGILIRCGHSRVVGLGTFLRALAGLAVLQVGLHLHDVLEVSGVVVAATAVATSVTLEAVFIGVVVRPIVAERLPEPSPDATPLELKAFLAFYLPLAMTPFLTLLIQPVGAAAMARMPRDLDSLAAWPAVHGLVFLFRSFGFALNEVVVAHAKDPGGLAVLRRFTFELAALLVGALLVVALSPLGSLWFGTASGFAEPLAALSASALLLAVLMPGYQTLQSYYQGVLVATGRTRPVTEAVALYLVVSCVGLGIAATWDFVTGLYAALGVFTIAGLSQTLWVRWRALPALRELSR
jgi:hypothetical protein